MTEVIKNQGVVVISDLHIGSPENAKLEDFDRDDDFLRLLDERIPAEVAGACSLVVAGDFIDFPQVLPELGRNDAGDRFGTTEEQSLLRLNKVIDGHPKVFGALATFLEGGNQVVLLPGNHDVDFFWKALRERLRDELGGPDDEALIVELGGVIHERGLHIEHGHQHAYDNRFDHWSDPILEAPDGQKRLERCWGTFFMDVLYNGLEEAYPFINQIHPTWKLAWMVVNALGREGGIPLSVAAKAVAFFAKKGKLFLLGHLLGEEPADEAASVEAILTAAAPDLAPAQRAKLLEETSALLEAEPETAPTPAASDDGGSPEGMLGRSDKRLLEAHAKKLLTKGDVSLVVFGHTHASLVSTPRGEGKPQRVFNTGSWMPGIYLSGELPEWSKLDSYPRVHELKLLAIELGDTPTGRLLDL